MIVQNNGTVSYYRPEIEKVHLVSTARRVGGPLSNLAQELVIRGFSKRTIKSYLDINLKFLEFLNKSAKEATSQDIKNYLLFLKSKNYSNTSLNLTISALKFYFEQVLKRKLFFSVTRPKKEQYLPVVLSKEEIVKLIDSTANIKHALLLSLLYGSGLRVSEVTALKINQVDVEQAKVLVKAGKGDKDRLTILSKHSAQLLKEYCLTISSDQIYLFPGAIGRGHLTERSAQKIFDQAACRAGIKKSASCHSLRHSFATHY
jgi:site-specific recombinase XerD